MTRRPGASLAGPELSSPMDDNGLRLSNDEATMHLNDNVSVTAGGL
jgi:hypothetical protein